MQYLQRHKKQVVKKMCLTSARCCYCTKDYGDTGTEIPPWNGLQNWNKNGVSLNPTLNPDIPKKKKNKELLLPGIICHS